MSDVRDILGIEGPVSALKVTKDAIIGQEKPKKKFINMKRVSKKPEGMAREVYALLCNDKKDGVPLLPTDTGKIQYQTAKANLSLRKVRPWAWTPFKNEARTDGAIFYHWQRVTDAPKEYPFAKFNKKIDLINYSDDEYNQLLIKDSWSREETDHLWDLSARFDLRFIIMADRWDREKFKPRSVEDLKERYYEVCGILEKARNKTSDVFVFDAEHEKKRKEQLDKFWKRTSQEIEEEKLLLTELKKIEARKRDRERKTKDLQKLISQADSGIIPVIANQNVSQVNNSHDISGNVNPRNRKIDKKITKKKLRHPVGRHPASHLRTSDNTQFELTGIKFPEFKNSGAYLRSQRIKLPANVGQKKAKAIEQMLQQLKLELNPCPTEEICTNFNDLRSDIVLNYELKQAISNCQFELQSVTHQYEAANPGQTLKIPEILQVKIENTNMTNNEQPEIKQEIIDVVGSPDHTQNT